MRSLRLCDEAIDASFTRKVATTLGAIGTVGYRVKLSPLSHLANIASEALIGTVEYRVKLSPLTVCQNKFLDLCR